MNNETLLVSVVMITYGHEKFIEQAINGVLMQECSFDFELIVANDCSPDNSDTIIQSIIDNHPKGSKLKYVRHNKNIGMNANADFAMANCKGKYIAICEGDDYWTDPLKLQKQINFLETNLDFGLVHTDCEILNQSTQKIESSRKKIGVNEEHFKFLLRGDYVIETLTTCFRKDLYLKYMEEIQPSSKKWLMGDLPMWLYISQFSKIYYINEVTSVYRVLEESASQSKNINKLFDFEDSITDMKMFFLEKYAKNETGIKSRIHSFSLYRKLVANIALKGSSIQFLDLLFQFYAKNKDLNLFLGSFRQIFKKSGILK